MTGLIVGEVPPMEIIRFLPEVKDAATPDVDFKAVTEGKGKENDMYKPFAKAIKDSGCCPGFTIRDTSSTPDVSAKLKPDFGIFKSDVAASDVLYKSLSTMDIVIEIKPESCQDAFHSLVNDRSAIKKEYLSKMTNQSIFHRGQQIQYVSNVMALQHRSHVFSISIIGHYARLIRWDRAGALVSERFNYHDGENSWLAEFLFRYSKATPEQRGFDCHVQKADKDDIALLDAAVKAHIQEFKYPAHLKIPLERTVDASYPAYKVHVDPETKDDEAPEGRDYIICRPFTEISSLCGRATRGYLAWGVHEKKLVFFKDTWRAEGEGLFSEAQIYKDLHGLNLDRLKSLLPTVLVSGDVRLSNKKSLQRTQTQKFADPKYQWFRPTAWLREHIRHRVVQELALPLHMVRNSKELLQAICNALEAIMLAYHEGGILHRDISAANIMLSQVFSGILNDWDHAIRVDPKRTRHPYRTGTWQFMSIDILMDANKPHSIHDDVESTFWVFYYIALHFFKLSPDSERPNLDLFDERSQVIAANGEVQHLGGQAKYTAIRTETIQRIKFESEPLTKALHHFAEILADYRLFKEMASRRRSMNTSDVAYAAKAIEMVDEIIASLNLILNGEGWPEHDDAVKDQFPKQTVMDSYREVADAQERSFTQALSSQSTGSRPIAGSGRVARSVGSSSGPAGRGSSRALGEPFNFQNYPRAPPLSTSGSFASGTVASSRTSLKRPFDNEGDGGLEEGSSDGRVKRVKDSEPEKDRAWIVGEFVGSLARKVSKVFRGKKD
ncbi:hypothetical protein BC629DRAFT_1732418 [Irpex lacteus]|nr:hypothetical protein BC629DRAFT_1732418 [Irpex lacteus]